MSLIKGVTECSWVRKASGADVSIIIAWICYGAQMWYKAWQRKGKWCLTGKGWRQTSAIFFFIIIYFEHIYCTCLVSCQGLDTVYELCMMDGFEHLSWGTMSIFNLCHPLRLNSAAAVWGTDPSDRFQVHYALNVCNLGSTLFAALHQRSKFI